jgi:chemotaxis protein histidine kinase CheA
LTHVIRNAVDHGIEATDERSAAGKPSAGQLAIRASQAGSELLLEVSDDGRGVDWARVAVRARSLGLPADSAEDLQKALFADGLSTREAATDISGRGIGMAAILQATAALGGEIALRSQAGRGTTVQFRFDEAAVGRIDAGRPGWPAAEGAVAGVG